MIPPTLRNRLLATLILVALIPAGIALVVGSMGLREIVQSSGTTAAWDEIALSGREMLELIEEQPPGTLPPEVLASAARHRDQLGASVRLARVYALLGERFLFLLPFFSLGLLLLIGALAVWAANRLSKRLAAPAEELASWTRLLQSGHPLPDGDLIPPDREVREFSVLRRSIREMAEELERTRARELEQARMRNWSEMARRVAHDIKNPLMPMRMAADRVVDSPDQRIASAGRVLIDEIDRLDEMARSFAQFGRPPEGPMSEIDVGELIASIARRTGDSPAPVKVHLPEGEVRILGHLDALERVLRNLIVNAQEASVLGSAEAEPAPVEVYLERTPTSGFESDSEAPAGPFLGARILVLDRGPGIDPDLLGKIWEPEFTTKRRGTGIGLPLVRQAVRAHGGEVWASNREGGGAQFRVQLPHDPGDPVPGTAGGFGS